MKYVLAGGSGQVGTILARELHAEGHEVVVLSRAPEPEPKPETGPAPWRIASWDARTLGAWATELDGADVVVNLAGRSVNCRYTPSNRRTILDSRVLSTVVVGEAIARAARPPRTWLQMSSAAIYAHRLDAPNDEATGRIGGGEPGIPADWAFSVEVVKAWEAALEAANTPRTRRVALRAAVVMSPDKGGIFDTLLGLVRQGLGGTAGDGRQMVSWIHERDFVRSIRWLIAHEDLPRVVNVTSPHAVPNAEFMRALRRAWGTRIGLPASGFVLELGAWLKRTEPELVLKSRWSAPGRLLAGGFVFEYPDWEQAAAELCARWRATRTRSLPRAPTPADRSPARAGSRPS